MVVGVGLAGLVAAAELAVTGRRVLLLDGQNARNVGGRAYWSFGACSSSTPPRSVAWARGTARSWRRRTGSDAMGRAWAEGFVGFASGPMREGLHGKGCALVGQDDAAEPAGRPGAADARAEWLGDRGLTVMTEDEVLEVRRRRLGYVLPSFGLIPSLSAAANVEVSLRLLGVDPRSRADRMAAALDAVGLGRHSRQRSCSPVGGRSPRLLPQALHVAHAAGAG